MSLPPASLRGVATAPCKVCDAPSPVFDAVDAAKNCGEEVGLVLPRTGTAVTYHRCPACGLVFTTWCDAFSPSDFAREIYNEGYAVVDPLYATIRPEANARMLREVLSRALRFGGTPRLLDYGSGSGALARALGDVAEARGYDPFSAADADPPAGTFDVVFSSEVLEHVTRPVACLAAMRDLLRPGGAMLFSTMVQPPDIEVVRGGWWYVAPRNGHVTIFTRAALDAACARAGLRYAALSAEWHLAERDGAPCAELDRAALAAIVAALPTGFVRV